MRKPVGLLAAGCGDRDTPDERGRRRNETAYERGAAAGLRQGSDGFPRNIVAVRVRRMSAEQVRYLLPEDAIPTHWVNLLPDLPGEPLPPLHPGTMSPPGPTT